ncbi:zinc finger MYM-type protein 2-like [Halichondria panicea]|uniref:zinc finger MYM-type protein 2-like n=1 Tax=Halichondria panicea TaxID=6063 RepID=UPI00312B942E
MALDLDFSDVTVEDLDDWEEVVSTSIMLRAEKDAAKIDWDAIPTDKLILGTEALSYVSKPRLAKRVKYQELQDVTNCAASFSASISTGASRFGSTVTNLTSLATASKGFVPANTKNNTSWALQVFYCWCEWRNSSHKETDDKVPIDVLTCVDATALNKWLSLFVMEAKKKNGSPYLSKTIDLLLAGIRRHMTSVDPILPNFFDENDYRFDGLRGTRDTVSRQLREDGVGSSVKHAEVITYEEEDKLWDREVLGSSTPKCLFSTIFFMNGKVLCLRGGRGHRALKLSQFTFGVENKREYVEYIEFGSKNRSGSYKDNTDNKVIRHFSDPSSGDRCYVYLLKKYLDKLPTKAKEDDSFYWKAKERLPTDADACWFTMQTCGKKLLGNLVKLMCEQVGIYGKTNHSLRATGATRLFAANVPEKLIAERTGHRSTEGLRVYERTSMEQKQSVSDIIACSSKRDFEVIAKEETSRLTSSGNPNKISFDNCENQCTKE